MRASLAKRNVPGEACSADGRGDLPGHITRGACGQVELLGGEVNADRCELHRHFHGQCNLAGVARSERRGELVALAYQGRDTGQQDEVLMGCDVRAAGAVQLRAGMSHRDDAKRRE